MIRAALRLLISLSCATLAASQTQSNMVGVAARARRINYVAGQVYTVAAMPGYELTIILDSDEHVQTVALGKAEAFQVTTSRSGSTLFVKVLQPDTATNMTVVTDVRSYAFMFTPASANSNALDYVIVFNYPRSAPPPSQPAR